MAYMIEGSGSKTWSKAKKWLYQNETESSRLLQKLTDVVVDHLVAQVRAGAQVCIKIKPEEVLMAERNTGNILFIKFTHICCCFFVLLRFLCLTKLVKARSVMVSVDFLAGGVANHNLWHLSNDHVYKWICI